MLLSRMRDRSAGRMLAYELLAEADVHRELVGKAKPKAFVSAVLDSGQHEGALFVIPDWDFELSNRKLVAQFRPADSPIRQTGRKLLTHLSLPIIEIRYDRD